MNSFIYYLFPRRCAVCSVVIPYKTELCPECEKLISPIHKKLCLRCGLPKEHCDCKKYAYHFRAVISPFLNADAAQRAIYGFKFSKNRDAADFFARHMAERIKEKLGDVNFECVTSVPMHPCKRSASGYDHAEILARAVAREMHLPYRRLLKKTENNKTQHTLSSEERFSNVKNAYTAKTAGESCVLLVDDIKTTGATLDECARQLMIAGCDEVYCSTAVIGS